MEKIAEKTFLEEKKALFSEYMRYTSMNIAGMIGTSCYILADTYFISKALGKNGLAALNIVLPVYSVIDGIGLMIGIGGATCFSIEREVMAKRENIRKNSDRIFTNSILLISIVSLLAIMIGLFFNKRAVRLLGADEETFEMSNIYLKVIMLFAPAFLLNRVISAFVRNDGGPGLAMIAVLLGSAFNVLFDYIFMFPCHLGMLGAVLATGFAPLVGVLILSLHFIKKKNSFSIIKSKINLKITKRTLSYGLSSFVNELSAGIVMVVFNFLMLEFAGNTGVAAYGVIANIYLVVIAMFNGIAQGIQPLVSKSTGRGDKKAKDYVIKLAVINALLLAVIIYGGLYAFSIPVVNIFNSEGDKELQMVAEAGSKIYFIGIFFAGINVIMSAFFSAANHPFKGQMVSLLRGIIVIVPCAYIMAQLFEITGVWCSFPVTELITLIIAGILLARSRNT